MPNSRGLPWEVWVKIYLWVAAIVAALFCAILEEGVTSGVIPYTAYYISYAVWMIPHLILLALELHRLKSNSNQARKYLLASVAGFLTFLILVLILTTSKVYISSWKAPFFVDVSVLLIVAGVWWCSETPPRNDNAFPMLDQSQPGNS